MLDKLPEEYKPNVIAAYSHLGKLPTLGARSLRMLQACHRTGDKLPGDAEIRAAVMPFVHDGEQLPEWYHAFHESSLKIISTYGENTEPISYVETSISIMARLAYAGALEYVTPFCVSVLSGCSSVVEHDEFFVGLLVFTKIANDLADMQEMEMGDGDGES